ncbi:hypothetical protein BU15DRAFT_74264 [Melanogaster broomeanus]|nr:hypothetical protein BU15DRAFT_74264 [Melanogaster broomeanus]
MPTDRSTKNTMHKNELHGVERGGNWRQLDSTSKAPNNRTAPIYKDNNPLAVPTITISKKGGTPKCTTKVPANLLQRVGVSLQKMLRHEFGDAFTNTDWKTPQKQMQLQNPLLSKYHPADALTRLKDQLKAYAKGIDPFDRPIRTKTGYCGLVGRRAERHRCRRAWDPPAIGRAPPQPRPFESPAESDDDSDCEGEFGSSDTTGLGWSGSFQVCQRANEDSGTAGVPVDNGARWLDKKRGLSGRAIHAERQRLALAGVSEIELSSPFFRDILDEPPKSRFQTSSTAKPVDTSSKMLSKAVPKASDWDTGRPSSSAHSSSSSDDSWDDMDCCGKCLDYFCVGARSDRERFRPWRRKSRAVIEAEERLKAAKRVANSPRYPTRTGKPAHTPNGGHPHHQNDSRRDRDKPASSAFPDADDATAKHLRDSQMNLADLQRIILQQQEQIEQLRREHDDVVALKRKGKEKEKAEGEGERHGLKACGREPRQSHEPQLYTAAPSSSHAGQPWFTSNITPSYSQGGPSTISNTVPNGRRFRFTQSTMDSDDSWHDAEGA